MTTIVAALAGVLFGLAIAAPPGPMNAIIAEESVLHAWIAGFRAGWGAITADVCFFLLALAGAVAFLERFPAVRGVMVGLGGLLMCYFAYGTVRDAQSAFAPRVRGARFDPATAPASGEEGSRTSSTYGREAKRSSHPGSSSPTPIVSQKAIW